MPRPTHKTVLWFKDLSHDDIPIAGGKGANLGEMYNAKIPVPNGFVVTSHAYFDFIKLHSLDKQIQDIIKVTNVNDPNELLQASKKIQSLINRKPFPDTLANEIMKSYKKLCEYSGLKDVPVAVRSSATAEDLPDASFAGQQETYLNVVGESNVVERVKDCWASLFTPRAIFYREKQHYDHMKVGIAVPIQKMINSLISGIMFTANPVTGDKSEIIVECIWGLGEYIVQGKVTPEQYIVDKNTFEIKATEKINQTLQLVRSAHETKEMPVAKNLVSKQKITPEEAAYIAKLGQKIHNHYGKPQDIEFAIDSERKVYIVQSRPITTLDKSKDQKNIVSSLNKYGTELLSGQPASPGVATGKVVILRSPKEIAKAQKGDVLVAQMTSPDYVPAMRRVVAIITNEGGQTSHAAIVSRELGVPCIVGTHNATTALKEGSFVTVDATHGKVYSATKSTKIKTEEVKQAKKIKTATKVYLNLGEPELAKKMSKKNVDGIGLLRAEFMIANIGVHPKRMIAEGKQEQYVNKLTNGLLKFARAFSPRPIVYRATDFKTNEYRHLKWGHLYEPQEPNPLLGFRGAARYISSPDVFNMELEAIKKVRNRWGLKNLHLMIPFVRTPGELLQVKKIVTDAGLIRSPSFKLFMMCEIPSNVIMLDEFIDVGIDGVSIGSNDLTMLTLGLDRDNSEVAKNFNELDPAVMWSLEKTVKTCARRGIHCSICGQAPSNHPDLVEKLVHWGISAVSVSPDAVDRTRELVHWAESKRVKR